ncbi:MAG: HNH endonuclease [Sphingomonas sp.]
MRTLQMAKRTYVGDGLCVFCRKPFAESDLTDEHIIPEALHGALVIKNGACRPCARHSNTAYENKALNGDLQLARILLDLRGKRGTAAPRDVRHMPPVFPGNLTMGGEGERLLDFPVEMYPKFFNLILFPPPGLLVGVDRGGALSALSLRTFTVGGSGLTGVTVSQGFTNGPFAMMLAKIAYCYAAAERGVEAFDGDPIRCLLTGERDDVYNFVGSVEKPEHLTTRFLHGLYFRERAEWTTVLINLFASLSEEVNNVRPYEVVVGRRA